MKEKYSDYTRTTNHITRLPELWTEVMITEVDDTLYCKKVKEWGNTCKQNEIKWTKEIDWKRGESYHSRIKKENPTTSISQLASMIVDMFDKEVHPELCRRILRNNDFHSRVPRMKPYIKAVNHKKRLTFMYMYIMYMYIIL